MQRRNWWIEIQPVHSMFNFKWQPFSAGINFKTLGNRRVDPPNQVTGVSFGPQAVSQVGQILNEAQSK